MEKIKIRAWDRIDKVMLPWNAIIQTAFNNKIGPSLLYQVMMNDRENFDLMLFTTLLDKNEKEIWESDIVKCGYGIGKVIYYLGGFWIEWVDDIDSSMEYLALDNRFRRKREDEEQFEVIGNYYEHKHLIEQ